MVSLIEGSARFMHRNYTNEGKIASIPKTIESLDRILDLSNRLKENGVDVSSLQESLAKNAVICNHQQQLEYAFIGPAFDRNKWSSCVSGERHTKSVGKRSKCIKAFLQVISGYSTKKFTH
jgi:hypothetical protein